MNVVACCIRCNQGKSDQTTEEFKTWIQTLARRIEEGAF